ncbi:MAG: RluA family pseudouridine synthase, partial [Pseudomonadota bacterium]
MTRNTPIPRLAPEDQDWVRRLVVHEDAALLVFNKPSGLPVQTRGNRGKTLDHLLWAFAKSNGKRPHLVHRLDSGTSGLIIAGRTKPAIAALSEAFASRDVKKTYLAAVAGRPKKDAGTCSGRIVKAGRKVSVTAKPDTGDRSRTDWSLIPPSTETHTLLMAIPYTGRMHQIRAHFADMN